MPNKKAKERKRKRIALNKQLKKEGRTARQREKRKDNALSWKSINYA